MNSEIPLSLLFTDIEGSTKIARQLGSDYAQLLGEHNELIRSVVAEYDGKEIENPGDGFFIIFDNPLIGLNAVIKMQQLICDHDWPGGAKVKVRMALHHGTVLHRSFGYAGIEIHRTSRICDSGHGGQVLLTGPFVKRLDKREVSAKFKKLGSYYLKDFEDPILLYQLMIPGKEKQFPVLRTTSAEPVLAVLPFYNLLKDKKSESLCEGFAEDLIIGLGRIPGLRMVSKSGSFNAVRKKCHI